ncbi:polysaccharide deacetylase family protein [Halomarina ordinaria]|uniref:Polysaccharide deacetylase family protein n=1 Tax=Halomarina ordinaria TaxID=3033939 RepID=A0ABD5U6Q6_9EURY|nr:polysaccharide deacetylase family protein [Halomarina sp. PSRA2]
MASAVISIDAELAWGFHDHEDPPAHERRRMAAGRSGWGELVGLLDEFDLPATWAVVGRLFLDEAEERITAAYASDGGVPVDPASLPGGSDRWYGSDLVERVRDADADHEIGCHSFTHLDFTDPETTGAVARAELRACREVAEDHGIDLESFVYPRNRIAHRDALAENGFTCYRGREPGRWYDGTPLRAVGKFASYAGGLTAPPVVSPTVDEYGLVNVPASLHLFGFERHARRLVRPFTRQPVVQQAKLGLERAVEEDGVFHVWFHPNDLMGPEEIGRVRAVLATIEVMRERGDITVETMGEVADRTLA